ncbi:MAG: dihydropteroate synthase [Candidatus Omnitrophica bacterium]|nr:dihydropteroate synthase [Candidatus Omnitrophota bacterium]
MMNIRMLSLEFPNEVEEYMRRLDVYSDGIKIMSPKANCFLVNLEGISSVAANILKQEMLSVAGEVAVPKDVILGKSRDTHCLVMGNLNQLRQLSRKLERQPFGLNVFSDRLNELLDNYLSDKFVIDTPRHKINIRKRTLIIGIVNLTPDSFSGDGLYAFKNIHNSRYLQEMIVQDIEKKVRDGADIIDVGGESTRPGSKPLRPKEEIARVVPIIKRIVRRIKVPISVDTYKPEVAHAALDSGADILNNIMGVKNDSRLLKVASRYRAGLVLMHIKGRPRTMQKDPSYNCLMGEIVDSLDKSIQFAVGQGVKKERIIIDPGIGFGKTLEHNLEILKKLSELRTLGRPILVGPSRKSFIGKVLDLPANDRLMGTAAAVCVAIKNGAHIVRVHDVKKIKETVKLTDAILNPN